MSNPESLAALFSFEEANKADCLRKAARLE